MTHAGRQLMREVSFSAAELEGPLDGLLVEQRNGLCVLLCLVEILVSPWIWSLEGLLKVGFQILRFVVLVPKG